MTDLAQHRLDLASARDEVRRCKDHYETIRAICELQIATTGKNEADRKRELTAALAGDERHRHALNELRRAEYAVDEVQAQIDIAEDERRAAEWKTRERLADALGGTGHEDQSFDHLTDRRVSYQARRAAMPASLDDLYPPR